MRLRLRQRPTVRTRERSGVLLFIRVARATLVPPTPPASSPTTLRVSGPRSQLIARVCTGSKFCCNFNRNFFKNCY